MQNMRFASTVAAVLLLAACSPYSYSKEVSKMSDGVDKLSDAYKAGFDGITADRANQLQAQATGARAIGQNPHIIVPPTCYTNRVRESDPPCALYLRGTPAPKWTEAESRRKKATNALKVLKEYANALAAVTNATDRTAYDAAVAQLAGAVGTILTPANAVAPGSSAAVSAGINIFGWLVGTALDEQRYDSLKKAVIAVGTPLPPEETADSAPLKSGAVCYDPAADPDRQIARSKIRVVTDGICNGLEALAAKRREILKNQVNALVDGLNYGKWSGNDYAKALGDAQTALAAEDALRRANPGSAANDLADAHDKLVEAIKDSNKNYTAFMKAVGDFADKVSAVEAALKATAPAKKGS